MDGSLGSAIEALHNIAASLQSQETIKSVCELTVSAAADILEFDLCTILIHEDEWLVPYAISKDTPADGIRRMRLDQGLAGKAYQSRESQLVTQIEAGDETDPAKPDYQSGISVPVGKHGVFQAVSTTEAAFDEGDIELAELLVSHTTTALDRINRTQELQQQVERLDQFASVISHDLRNPLNIAQGYLNLAREERDSESLQRVGDAHERMDRLIGDMLIFARAGSEALDLETVELARLLEICWASLEQENATLHVGTTQRIRADRDHLRQLIENLLSNAVKHGGTDVSITVGALEGGFYIEDDGVGIPAEERTAVFEAGHSLGTSGTGFGLSIAQQVAESHGWEVRVIEGTEGGARFEITGVEGAGT